MWFKKLTGFDEVSPEHVKENILIEGNTLYSKVNDKSYQYGSLQIPTLKSLKEEAPPREVFKGKISISEIVADVKQLHCNRSNRNALFQAASQFNLLEMVGPHIAPEHGIDIYEKDHTQGPACAIACGAGTIYRNYFVPLNGQTGQSADTQIDCLDLIAEAFNNEELQLWKMNNGYALFNQNGLLHINQQIGLMNNSERDTLKEKLKIGIQWNTEVTLNEQKQIVSQAYCSALPVAYSHIESYYWENFSRIILEATYEATLYAALINLDKTDCNKVFLTLVGGGAFGNEPDWILESMITALKKFSNTPLDVKIVSYGKFNPLIRKVISGI